MKIIDLYVKIASGKVKDKTKFRIAFNNGLYRDFYYDAQEENELCCLKNISDDYSLYDDIKLTDEIQVLNQIEEEKKIPEKLSTWFSLEKDCENDNIQYANNNFKTMYEKINEICDYLKSKGE